MSPHRAAARALSACSVKEMTSHSPCPTRSEYPAPFLISRCPAPDSMESSSFRSLNTEARTAPAGTASAFSPQMAAASSAVERPRLGVNNSAPASELCRVPPRLTTPPSPRNSTDPSIRNRIYLPMHMRSRKHIKEALTPRRIANMDRDSALSSGTLSRSKIDNLRFQPDSARHLYSSEIDRLSTQHA